MKIVLWSFFGLSLLVWTVGAALFVQIVEWSAGVLSSGGVTALRDAALSLPLPEWLAPWLALTAWQELVDWTASVINALSGLLPLTGELLGRLTPLIWTVWGIGTLLMLLITWFVSRFIN